MQEVSLHRLSVKNLLFVVVPLLFVLVLGISVSVSNESGRFFPLLIDFFVTVGLIAGAVLAIGYCVKRREESEFTETVRRNIVMIGWFFVLAFFLTLFFAQ